ncbi:NAD(P)-dependent oxidoreductase [Nesterenkonia rhizosphaerae]|uniref:Phosphoglycerate dehydrogenase n=1 Tax=Nesterenkonia rhizosphaerae TaxID=1348272 RepID=A0ABP9FTB8_9MICC
MEGRPVKVLLPADLELPVISIDGAEFVSLDLRGTIPEEHRNAEAIVEWGTPAPLVAQTLAQLPALRWVQSLSAGPNHVLAQAPDHVLVTGGSGLHDKPVAEHTLALILSGLRRVHLAVRAQQERRWATELGGLQPEYDPHAVTTLRGARVLIWGYGNIARELTGHLRALGATVTGAARSPRTENGVSVVGAEGLEEELKRTDVLVMILPGSDSTHHALNASRLALLPARSWVVNVGRGTAIDQQALLEAVREGRLAGAALDVTDPEPLPSDSPLWYEPGIIITPHAAGGRPLDAARLIEANVRAYLAGEPLRNVLQAGSPA